MGEWTKQWIPTPAKVWTAIVIILCISAIYSYFQEYSDVQGIQMTLNDISDQIDAASQPPPTVIISPRRPIHIPPPPTPKVHHRFHPSNPIAELLGKIFHH